MTATCATCRFWDSDGASRAGSGYCRKNTPTCGETVWGRWPVTAGRDWCGEHDEGVAVYRPRCATCGERHPASSGCLTEAIARSVEGLWPLCQRCWRRHDPAAGCAPSMTYSGISGEP